MANDKTDILEKLTSLADNEIKDESVKSMLLAKIEEDSESRFEYGVQRSVKNLVGTRLPRNQAPAYLRANIVNSLNPVSESTKYSISSFISNLIKRPGYAIAFAVIILIMIIFPYDSSVDITASDMFVQAENNFDNIMAGKLIPQKLCNSSKEVKDFFNTAGVKYATVVPEFSDWRILGAVVSSINGEKLAHHVYTDNDGHIIYLYQVCEEQLTEEKLLALSPYLLSKCKTKRFIKFTSDSHSTYFFLHNNNIFALVTNEDDLKIEHKFIAGLISNQNF